jgi:hypothetical protein
MCIEQRRVSGPSTQLLAAWAAARASGLVVALTPVAAGAATTPTIVLSKDGADDVVGLDAVLRALAPSLCDDAEPTDIDAWLAWSTRRVLDDDAAAVVLSNSPCLRTLANMGVSDAAVQRRVRVVRACE